MTPLPDGFGPHKIVWLGYLDVGAASRNDIHWMSQALDELGIVGAREPLLPGLTVGGTNQSQPKPLGRLGAPDDV